MSRPGRRTHTRLRKLFNPARTPLAGNRIRLLQSGTEFFPALIAAIDAAHTEIRLETYIFYLDNSGTRVGEALMRAAARGVRVALLLDGVGSRLLPISWLNELKHAGVRALVYRPPHFGWLTNPLNLRRLHRKITVIDAHIAFIGGINIIDDFVPVAWSAPRLDYSLEIRGPLLAEIYPNVTQLWRLVARSQLQPALYDLPKLEANWPSDGNASAAFIVRDNFRHRHTIENAYLAVIARAQQNIVIASAYFLPGRRFRQAIKKATERGVDVRLLVQGRTDHPFFHAASRALYDDLLRAGVTIFEYHASELHAKVAVVDSHWVTVGSSNIDPFSLLLAREANVVSEDRALALELETKLQHAIENGALQLLTADWQRRAWPHRLLSWVAYGCVRWVVGLAGFKRWA